MMLYLFAGIGFLITLYFVVSVYPAFVVHCLEDSRAPDGIGDFFRMTYLPYLFKCKNQNIPY